MAVVAYDNVVLFMLDHRVYVAMPQVVLLAAGPGSDRSSHVLLFGYFATMAWRTRGALAGRPGGLWFDAPRMGCNSRRPGDDLQNTFYLMESVKVVTDTLA